MIPNHVIGIDQLSVVYIIYTLEEVRGVKETESSLTEISAALRTMKRVSATISTSMETVPVKVQAMRSGMRRRSYRFGTANLGRRG